MTKIIMLNFEFPPIGGGGGNASRQLLLQYAGRSDLSFDVLTSAPEPGFVKKNFADNITIYKVGIHKKNLQFWRKSEVIEWLFRAGFYYRRLLRENNYDLAHVFFGFPTGWLCYRSAGKLPYIVSLRGSDVPGEHVRLKLDYKILSPIFKAIWKKASILVTPSEGLKRRALKFFPSAQIEVIPNGVDLERFHPAEVPTQSEQLRLITVGRLSMTKRVEMLIEAVKILVERGYKIRFVIVGSGMEQESLRKIISQNSLDDVVEMTGRIDSQQMPDLYRNGDLYISASMQEGMSNAMLEAMASGLPIITTRCEGVDELINDNGIVLEQADAEKIALTIKRLADNEQERRQMSLAARTQAEDFSWKTATEAYHLLYEGICKKKQATKVCFVCPKAYPLFNPMVKEIFGGAELDLYTLSCELEKDADYEVSCVVADYGQDDVEIINGVKVYKGLNFRKSSLAGALQIWRTMRQANADIYVQETAGPGTFLVAFFCRFNGRGFVYRTAHQRETDGTYIRAHPLSGHGFRWALKNASHVIVQNEQDREQALKNIGVDSKVIRNAHELSQPTEDDRDIILWVGRSAAFKRPQLFLQLAKRVPDEQFVIICQHATGDSEYDNLKKEAVKISNLEFIEHVSFRDIMEYFNRAKMYVNTSSSEGFANTFVDACKSGTPILSLSVNPDNFIDENECGLCAKGDWDYFIELFDNLRKDMESIFRFGSNGRKYAEDKHDITKIVKIYKDLFEGIVTR